MRTTQHPLEAFHYCPKCGSKEFVVSNDLAKHCRSCGFTYYLNPSAACMCFITDRYNRVLVAVRGVEPAKGTLDLPGGFIECYETAEEGMAREIREETSINPESGFRGGVLSPIKYLFSRPNIYRYSGFDVHTVDMVFQMEVESLDPFVGTGKDDVQELKAIPLHDLNPGDFGLVSVSKAVEMVQSEHFF